MTNNETPFPDWISEGAEVAIYTTGFGTADPSVKMVSIAKVQKLHIITDDGAKFSRRGLESIKTRGVWSSRDFLLQRSHADVVAALKMKRTRNAVNDLRRAIDGSRLYGSDATTLLEQVNAIREAATTATTRLRRILED